MSDTTVVSFISLLSSNGTRLVRAVCAGVAIILLGISLSTQAQEAAIEYPIKIVTTTTQVTDLTIEIAGAFLGTAIEITPLMGAGVDPHLYKPTESDIAAMNAADLVLYSGLHLEGQFDAVFEALGQQNVRTYAVSQPVKDAGFIIGGFNLSDELQNVDDPHFWFDPRNWQLAALGVAEVVGEADPSHAEFYLENAEAYNAELDLLYTWALEAMSLIPEEQRVLVTSHDAFQYFGDAFGWQVRGLQGISTVSEAGVADIQEIATFVVENDIPVIFIESSVPPDAIEAVQEAVEAQGGSVNIGTRELFSDAMGEPDTFAGTYIGMIAENVITILQSFEVEAPPLPVELELEIPEDLRKNA